MSPAAEAFCETCGKPFRRRTSERVCPDCLAPLHRLRKQKGLTQAELAARGGCRRMTIQELERDQYQPALSLAERLADELDVDVLDVFPKLQITKAEARQLLGVTSRTVAEWCEDGTLPATTDGHWHRLDYAAVLRLAREREQLRSEWISFHAAEREYALPWWLLADLQEEGKLDVRIGDRRGTRLVRRAQLAAVRQELVDNRHRVHCPHCRRWPKLGRKAHAKCRGPLVSHAYWLDPETREVHRRTHSELIRARLAARKPDAKARWYYNRFKSTKLYGRLAAAIAAERGKKPGPKYALSDDERAEIRDRYARGQSQRQIAKRMGVTHKQVRGALDEKR